MARPRAGGALRSLSGRTPTIRALILGSKAPLADRLALNLRRLQADRPVLVALSGGGDSVALLLLLRELGLDLAAAHLDHGLRPESGEDRLFCEGLCRRLGVPFDWEAAKVAELAAASGMSREAAGRRLRYQFLASVRGGRLVATGHTMDDQAETVLLRAIEGCGPGGLSGIRPRCPDWLIRPLLPFRRRELRDYLAVRREAWLEDPTNLSPVQPRARIRNVVLPMLAQMNPRVVEALARLARSSLEDHSVLEERARDFLSQQPPEGLLVAELQALPAAVRRRVLLLACRAAAVDRPCRIEGAHLEQLEALLAGPAGRWRPLPGGLRADRSRDRLRVGATAEIAPPPPAVIPLEPGSHRPPGWSLELRLQHKPGPHSGVQSAWTVWLDPGRLPGELTLRSRRPGDRMRPFGGAGGKKLKKLLQEAGIPRWQRERFPVLADAEDRIVWVIGLRVDERFAAGPEARSVLEIAAVPDRQAQDS
ncbi:MAG: tRNA lysidine(34) synthetase TilS [Armatimonadetes bacterium]|nr:tRNA lysidine(34) synthetase TilS [Armatimonadota bacterium]